MSSCARPPLVRWQDVLATALGSTLAALILSRLGALGTVLGAALTPVIITVTQATVSRQLERARGRGRRLWRRLPWGRRLAAALTTAALAFAVAVVAITALEAAVGKPMSDWDRRGGSGYTFGGSAGSSRPSTPPPADTPATTKPGAGTSTVPAKPPGARRQARPGRPSTSTAPPAHTSPQSTTPRR